DASYRTLAAREHRGIAGKSSGGYGAMITPMLRPDLWGGLATHAGDALFENCYQPEFRITVRALRDDYDGSYDNFWKDFRSRPAFSKPHDGELLNSWCMAACYSADPDGTVRLPFDTNTGELIPDIWERCLALDFRGAALERGVRKDVAEPRRQPPVPVTHQPHRSRDKHDAHDRRVEEHRDGKAEAHRLDRHEACERERAEDGHHDRGRTGDD